MAHDVVSLMNHLGIAQFDCVAYSMGARVALEALALARGRARRAVLIAVGSFAPGMLAVAIAARLRGEQTDNPIVEGYCQFVRTVTSNDLEALACCLLAPHRSLGDDIWRIAADVLVVVGEYDDLRDEAQAIAAHAPRGQFMLLNGLNHKNIHLAARSKSAAVAFLEGGREDWTNRSEAPPRG
jgi:pimeloyl-ACP methyl ester carboxylesterase